MAQPQIPGMLILPWGKRILRGIGQVMFQGHAGTGILFLAGLAVASPVMAGAAFLGSAIGTMLAAVLQLDPREIDDGIHGFNPTLVAIALVFFLDPGQIFVWVLLAAGCVASTIVCYLMRRFLPFPTYTTPFIVCTWCLLLLAHQAVGPSVDHPPTNVAVSRFAPSSFLGEILAGEAEVMFGANVLTGLLFLAGVALSNWRHGVFLFAGSLIGTLTAIYHRDPEATITVGIYGYNAALAAVAVYLWRKSLLHPLLAAIVAVPLTEFFPAALGTPALTAPFVASAWIVIAIGSLERFFCTD